MLTLLALALNLGLGLAGFDFLRHSFCSGEKELVEV